MSAPPKRRIGPLPSMLGTECGRSSGVEHNLAKVGVVGSNPIARSKFSPMISCACERFGGSADAEFSASGCRFGCHFRVAVGGFRRTQANKPSRFVDQAGPGAAHGGGRNRRKTAEPRAAAVTGIPNFVEVCALPALLTDKHLPFPALLRSAIVASTSCRGRPVPHGWHQLLRGDQKIRSGWGPDGPRSGAPNFRTTSMLCTRIEVGPSAQSEQAY